MFLGIAADQADDTMFGRGIGASALKPPQACIEDTAITRPQSVSDMDFMHSRIVTKHPSRFVVMIFAKIPSRFLKCLALGDARICNTNLNGAAFATAPQLFQSVRPHL